MSEIARCAFSLFLFLTYLRLFFRVFKVWSMVVDHKPLDWRTFCTFGTLLAVIHFVRCVVGLIFSWRFSVGFCFMGTGGGWLLVGFSPCHGVSLSPLRSNNKYCYRERADGGGDDDDDDDGGYNEMRPLLLLAFLFHLIHSF